MNTLAQSILKTLSYSDYFDYPLTLQELHTRLITHKLSKDHLFTFLTNLSSHNQVGVADSYYFLPGRDKLVALRKKRAQLAKHTLPKIRQSVSLLSHFPGVLAIYLTGSHAVKNVKEADDIDLMVITEPNRLWTTRLFLTLYLTMLNRRRTPHSIHNQGKLCLNLYLDPLAFTLPSNRRSLYTAYELIQATPLYDPQDTHPHLLAANPWIYAYLPNIQPTANTARSDLTGTKSSPKGQTFMGYCEFFSFHLQRFYMHHKITREYITPHSAFFHPHDPSAKLLAKLAL